MNQEYLLAAMPPDVRKGYAFPRTLINSLRLQAAASPLSVGIAQISFEIGLRRGESPSRTSGGIAARVSLIYSQYLG